MLMVGVGTLVVFGSVLLFFDSTPRRLAASEMRESVLLESLVNAEFKYLISIGLVSSDMTLALDPELPDSVRDAVKELGLRWTTESEWPDNQGVPPPGIVSVSRVALDGDQGTTRVIVGETAHSEACGTTIDSSFVWEQIWTRRESRRRVC